MAMLMPGEMSGMPNEYGFGKQQSDRKRKMAEALRQQAIAPKGQMVGGIYVAPSITEYLAGGLRGYQANEIDRKADEEEKSLFDRKQKQMTDAQTAYMNALRPQQVQTGVAKQPFEPGQMDRFGSPMPGQQQATQPVMGTKQPTPQDIFNAQLQYAQSVGDPNLMMQASNQRVNYDIGQQEREDNQAFRSQEAQLQRQQRQQDLLMQLEDRRVGRDQQEQARRELAQMNIDARRDLAGIAASNRPEKMISIMGEDGVPVLVPQSQAQGATPYSPAMAKQMKLKETTGKAKNEVTQIVDQLGAAYGTLKTEGGITSAKGGLLGNLGAMASNTDVGQLVGRVKGSPSQQARDTIAQTRPLLLNAIKNATGMSAQQMNSNAEMQLYLRAATDPSLGYEANAKALENLDKLYGLGMYSGGGGQEQSGKIGAPPAGAVRRKQ
jgi:hypothetical protein